MRLPEQVTIWNIYENNRGTGSKSYDEPVTVPARIAYSNETATDRNGDTFTSTAVFYTEYDDINERSIVFLGVSTELDPSCVKSRIVRKITRTPSGTGLKKIWL